MRINSLLNLIIIMLSLCLFVSNSLALDSEYLNDSQNDENATQEKEIKAIQIGQEITKENIALQNNNVRDLVEETENFLEEKGEKKIYPIKVFSLPSAPKSLSGVSFIYCTVANGSSFTLVDGKILELKTHGQIMIHWGRHTIKHAQHLFDHKDIKFEGIELDTLLIFKAIHFLKEGVNNDNVRMKQFEDYYYSFNQKTGKASLLSYTIRDEEIKPALEYEHNYEFGESVPDQGKDKLIGMIERALTILFIGRPEVRGNPYNWEGDNLLEWNGDRELLRNKKFKFSFVLSNDQKIKNLKSEIVSNIKTFGFENFNALSSITRKEEDTPVFQIETIIILDRIMKDKEGKTRTYSDSLTRLTLAMAHEIFGNVQVYLKIHFKEMENRLEKINQQELELNSLRKGVRFLKWLTVLKKFNDEFEEELKEDFRNLLKEEEMNLEIFKGKTQN